MGVIYERTVMDLEKKLWIRVQKYSKYLQFIPFIKMVAVCNNLSFGKVDKYSDIDLFIVAKTGRLFFVRTFVTFLFSLLGVRRHGRKISGRFCLSFFIDEEYLDLSKIAFKNDYYLAFWVKNLAPVLDSDNFSHEFLVKNSWINRFFNEEEFDLNRSYLCEKKSILFFVSRFFTFCFNARIGDFIENKLMKWQLKRAKMKAVNVKVNSGLIINEHILKFHNVDMRSEYNLKWEKLYGENVPLVKEKFLKII